LPVVFMGVELGLLQRVKNIIWGCSKTGC